MSNFFLFLNSSFELNNRNGSSHNVNNDSDSSSKSPPLNEFEITAKEKVTIKRINNNGGENRMKKSVPVQTHLYGQQLLQNHYIMT